MEKDVYLQNAIAYSQSIMFNGRATSTFSEFCRGYLNTNECIKEYLSNVQYAKGRALTVLSSGDHVFNLIHDGVTEIDAFDINRLQYYVYFLRRALILAFSYNDFIDFNLSFTQNDRLKSKLVILEKIKSFLPIDVYLYFKNIINFALAKEYTKFSNLYFRGCVEFNKENNNYLANSNEYEKLRRRLEITKVNLYFENAVNIPKIVSGNYDIVLLSNIGDYISQFYDCNRSKALSTFIQGFLDIINDDGVIISYLFDYISDFTISLCEHSSEDIFRINNKHCDFHGYHVVRKRLPLQ